MVKRILRLLHSLSSNCGLLPLLAAAVLLMSVRVCAIFDRPVPLPVTPRAEVTHPDFALIDAVLAKRAPELGLTLRHQLGMAIAEEAQAAGYDPLLILAIINVESEFEEDAVSSKGARGLMQIQPPTLAFVARRQGLRLRREEVAADPALCVRLGVRYLKSLQVRFGGDLDLALMAYNGGPGKIHRARKNAELDAFRFYPNRVRRGFRHFREGAGLGGDWALAQRDLARE